MENERVGELFSDNKGGIIAPFSHKKIFEEHCAYYLAIGMSADEYWYGDAELTRDFRKAYELRVEHENFMAYLNGFYVYKALLYSAPVFDMFSRKREPLPYDEKPIPITEKMLEDERKRQEEEWIKSFKLAADRHNKLLAEKKGEK